MPIHWAFAAAFGMWRYRMASWVRPKLKELLAGLIGRGVHWGVGFACLVTFALWARIHQIEQLGPYCPHQDEQHWTSRAIDILQTGELNPGRFTKPSVMVYLNTFGLALGLLRGAARGEPVYLPDQLGTGGGFPYYLSETAIDTVRIIYALLSVAAMLLAALTARKLSGSNGVALLALLLMLAAPEYTRYSWYYLNVDILGCFFAMAALAYSVLNREQAEPAVVAAIAGVLAGLTLGTKYNLWPIATSGLLMILFFHRRRWLALSVLFVVCMGLAFLVSTPYALLDMNTFVSQAAGEAHHYATGHKGKPLPSGLPMAWRYATHLLENFSPIVLLLSFYGFVRQLWVDTKRTLIVFVYPASLFVYMSMQSTFFARNLLVLHLVIPMLAAIGAVCVTRAGSELLAAHVPRLTRLSSVLIALVMIGAPVLLTMPWSKLARAQRTGVESRVEAVRWIRHRIPRRTTLLVPKQLNMQVSALTKTYSVRSYDATKAKLPALGKKYPGAIALVAEFRREDRARVTQRGRARPIARFGRRPLTLEPIASHGRRRLYTPNGDPKFTVVRL